MLPRAHVTAYGRTTSSPLSAIDTTLDPAMAEPWYPHPHAAPGKRKGHPGDPTTPHHYPYPYTQHEAATSIPPPSSSPTAGTFVACTKCRHRKIKCGGQRPVCENCEKKGLECVYDVIVKRRGPDKKPGGRMKKRQSGGADSAEAQQDVKPVVTGVSPGSTTTPSSTSSAHHLPDETKPHFTTQATAEPPRYWNPSSNGTSIPPTASNSPETVLSIPRSRAHSSSSHGAFPTLTHFASSSQHGLPMSYGYPPQQQQPQFTRPYPAYEQSYPMGPPTTHSSGYQHSQTYPPLPPPPPLHLGSGYHLQGSAPYIHPPGRYFASPPTLHHQYDPGYGGRPASHPPPPPAPPPQQQQQPQEVWSPSVLGKLGMADLVTGYDPVQHIAAGANVGLGLTTTTTSTTTVSEVSNPHSENGDSSDDRTLALQNGRGEDAFTRGLKLERLPNTMYARESDWVWMTGLFSSNRQEGIRMLDTELRFFFDMNMQWFQFFNRSLFFTTLYHDVDRYEIQPALILSMLAITTLVKSAHQGPHAVGKQNAVTFADAARSMIQQSIVANKVDPTLAQAALVLMAFEFYPYPQHSFDRTVSAVHLFDGIAHMFQLLASDVSDDRVSIFIPGAVPVLTPPPDPTSSAHASREEIVRSSHEAEEQEEIKQLVKWSPRPQWPVHWSVAQVRQDEARRMCWTASSMIANFSLWTHTLGMTPLDLYMSNPANYALFFPAESLLVNKDPVVGKQTMWALYNRVVLLWHFTLKSHHTDFPPDRRDLLYEQIWHETHRIEDALFHIGMNAGQTQKWQARDWIINILSLITDNFARFTPGMLEGTQKTGDVASVEGYRSWVKQQAELGALLRAMSSASGTQVSAPGDPPPPPAIISRPFFAWPLLHMVHNALVTFELDHSRFETIKIAAGVLGVVKTISDAWPNAVLGTELAKLQAHFNRIVRHGDLPADWATRPILTPEEQAALAELQIVLANSPP